ncbi:MAG: hypothetical protein AB1689_16490 [Thermodesulfobacteriota bacterium]
MSRLPTWMRVAMLATALMNVAVAPAFLPAGEPLRVRFGFPPGGEPFYVAMAAMFVLLFGLGYLWTGVTGRADRTFILVAGVGKCSFFLLLAGFWLAGALPARAPLSGLADLLFGLLFLGWLARARERVDAAERVARAVAGR